MPDVRRPGDETALAPNVGKPGDAPVQSGPVGDDGGRPQPGDLLLYFHARGMNRIITWFTRSPYYHVAFYEGDFKLIEARPKGVVRQDMRTRKGGGHFRVIPSPTGKSLEALQWAQSKVGDGYDHFDLVVIVLEHIFHHLHLNYTPRDKFTCGEFVAMAFQQVGAPLFPDRSPADVVPADFAKFL